ncbi:tyrosine-type recombinase/integrase [Allorhizocola rhizosphaerae]|uniref:tyrosine-type recombinase/integrase n=1 Tax=Allorhizocola rhizosphaerae TaxID=1872709 RepID=UPI001B8C31F5|nr:site-specific integrase [Allorhizocola rhizosphaerae]
MLETPRDLRTFVVPRLGRIAQVEDVVVPVRLLDPVEAEVDEVTLFLRDMRACDRSVGSLRSYGLALLRWYRFLWAAGVCWDRAGRDEARDFMLWLDVERKPRQRKSGPAAGSVNPLTRKAYPGSGYAPRTRRHNWAVVRAFYEFHREHGTGPLVNPMPARRARHGGRADGHHNPLQQFDRSRRADFQPKLAHRAPPHIPNHLFAQLFAAMRTDRDRAILAFYISTAARASELLGVSCDRVDVGQQLVGVYRKGSGDLQWLPASADAFVWLALYQRQLRRVSREAGQPLWWTLRRPHRALAYAAMRAVLIRAQKLLGTNWTLHDLRHTAAKRMIKDPSMSLADVQWVLGHRDVRNTMLYLEPDAEEVVERMRAHHLALSQHAPTPPVPAAGYRPEMLATLLGGR